jgi:hypothetical protein
MHVRLVRVRARVRMCIASCECWCVHAKLLVCVRAIWRQMRPQGDSIYVKDDVICACTRFLRNTYTCASCKRVIAVKLTRARTYICSWTCACKRGFECACSRLEFEYLYGYAHVHIYIYIYIFIHTYIHHHGLVKRLATGCAQKRIACSHACAGINVNTCTYNTCIFVYICVYISAYYIFMSVHVCMYMYIYSTHAQTLHY